MLESSNHYKIFYICILIIFLSYCFIFLAYLHIHSIAIIFAFISHKHSLKLLEILFSSSRQSELQLRLNLISLHVSRRTQPSSMKEPAVHLYTLTTFILLPKIQVVMVAPQTRGTVLYGDRTL